MGILDKVKKKAKNLPIANELSEQLNRVEDIINDFNNQSTQQIDSIKETATKSINNEIDIIRGKVSYVDGVINNMENKIKVSVDDVVNKATTKAEEGVKEIANDLQKKIDGQLEETSSLLKSKTESVVSGVEAVAKQKLEEAIAKAEKEAMKKFEKEMGTGFITFILNRLKEFFK